MTDSRKTILDHRFQISSLLQNWRLNEKASSGAIVATAHALPVHQARSTDSTL